MYTVPCNAKLLSTCRGLGAWRGAFFFGGRLEIFGTPLSKFVLDCDGVLTGTGARGAFRRELNDEMNSIDCGVSPRRPLKCSTAACTERVFA